MVHLHRTLLMLMMMMLVAAAAPQQELQQRKNGGGVKSHIPKKMLIAVPVNRGRELENPFGLTMSLVEPVIQVVLEDIVSEGLARAEDFSIKYIDTNCSDTYGPHRVIEEYCKKEVDVIVGFANPYALAPVARLSWLWTPGVPVLTTTSLVHQLDDRRTYRLLTRMNGSYKQLGLAAVKILDTYKFNTVAFFVQSNLLQSELGSTECYFALAAVFKAKHEDEGQDAILRNQHSSILFDPGLSPDYEDYLRRVSLIGNIILLCASPHVVRDIMLAADKLGMVQSGEYVFFNVDVSGGSTPEQPWYKPSETKEANEKAKMAFRALKTITLRKSSSKKYQEFEARVRKVAERNYKKTTGRPYELNNFVSAFYDAVMLYSIALNETMMLKGKSASDGFQVTQQMWNRTFEGVTGNVTISSNGDRYSDYSLLDYDPTEGNFTEVAYYSGAQDTLIQGTRNWYWVGGKPPADTPVCGYDRAKCPKKELAPWAWLLIVFFVVTFCFAVVSFFIYRHYKLEAELAAMTWRIRWEELRGRGQRSKTAAAATDKKKKENGVGNAAFFWLSMGDQQQKQQQQQKNANHYGSSTGLTRVDSKMSLAKGSIGSCETIQLSDMNKQQIFTKTASYKGVIVAVKPLNISRPKIELSRSLLMELKKMKNLQHDHVTRFVGACIDPDHYCIVSEYCPKGSLQDILENEEIQLDKMMIYSLMHDIVKGMDFIHSTDVRAHGNLKSSNCVVDGRFVLKITDFGLHHLRALEDPKEDEESHAYWQKKLWTAPELLRIPKPACGGTQKGDVYSFSIILHEMAFRQGAFYIENDSVPPQEIIDRVKLRQEPPFRPSIIDDGGNQADEAMVQLMSKCWAENPSDRPDFASIRKQVRSLNREYETSNIVDNLLKRMEQYATNLEALVEERTADYLDEKRKAENLLHQLLPPSVADQLIKGQSVAPESFDMVTIYFSDIVGFTSLCSQSTPFQVVNLLNDLYTCFDSIIENFNVYKVETIGDAYMVVSGLPQRNVNLHAYEIARMSLALLTAVRTFRIRHRPEEQLKLRIGIHSGPVCAGVVGLKMPRYCLFGDTVNTASRMESNGLPLKIHVSSATKCMLDDQGCFQLELRGEVEMKGKGKQLTYWLVGQRSPSGTPPFATTAATRPINAGQHRPGGTHSVSGSPPCYGGPVDNSRTDQVASL